MTKSLLLSLCLLTAITTNAQQAQLIVEKVDNGGIVTGQTYRIWAAMSNPDYSLHLVWGDQQDPLFISSTAPFFQHALGSQASTGMNESIISLQPELAFDSYVTVGYDRALNNNLWELGIDFSAFNQGGSLSTTNGAWFLLPTDTKCQPAPNGLVLIAQLTSEGTITGSLNLQGWSEPQQPWRVRNATFSTTDAKIFGCTRPDVANFNPNATFDNGSCEGASTEALSVASATGQSGWDVFPNPVRESLIHVQFHGGASFGTNQARIEIFDMGGKRVGSHPLTESAMIGGNRITITQELAQGTYSVVLVCGDKTESRTIIVQR